MIKWLLIEDFKFYMIREIYMHFSKIVHFHTLIFKVPKVLKVNQIILTKANISPQSLILRMF